jgi:hypothetical protein
MVPACADDNTVLTAAAVKRLREMAGRLDSSHLPYLFRPVSLAFLLPAAFQAALDEFCNRLQSVVSSRQPRALLAQDVPLVRNIGQALLMLVRSGGDLLTGADDLPLWSVSNRSGPNLSWT